MQKQKRVIVNSLLLIGGVCLIWSLLARSGFSPIGTPIQQSYLPRKLARTTKIVIHIQYVDIPRSYVITDLKVIQQFAWSLWVPRMSLRCAGDPAEIIVDFIQSSGQVITVGMCGECPRLIYENPWNMEAPIPKAFASLISHYP